MLKLSDIWNLNKVRHMLKIFKIILFLTLYTHIYTSFFYSFWYCMEGVSITYTFLQ